MKEIWKSVFDGYYEVSNLGRFRRIKSASNGTRTHYVLKQYSKRGYMQVCICMNYIQKWVYVHVMVANEFIGSPPVEFTLDGDEVVEINYQVNHKDLDKSNNRWDNLEWVTPSANVKHAIENGVSWGHPSSLTYVDAVEIRNLYKTGKYSQKDLAIKFGLKSDWPIWAIVNNKRLSQ